MPLTAEPVVRLASRLGEGPRWSRRDGCVWWIDILGRQVHRWNPDSGTLRSYPVPGDIGMIAERTRGGWVLGLRQGLYALDVDSGVCTALGASHEHGADYRFNDGACDAAGRLWIGTMHDSCGRNDAALYRFDPGLARTRICSATIANGLGWSPDGTTMYWIDTPTQTVAAFPFDAATGQAGAPSVVVRIPNEMGSPDGLCVDAEGMLWIGLWGGGMVLRCDPASGRVLERVLVPEAKNITACSFGGEKLDVLYITSAGGGDAGAPANAGHLFAVRPSVTGLLWHAFAG